MKAKIYQLIFFLLIILSIIYFHDCGSSDQRISPWPRDTTGKNPIKPPDGKFKFERKQNCDTLFNKGNQDFYAVMFINPHKGIAVGRHGMVTITKDGGDTWTTPVSIGPKHLYGVTAADSSLIVAVGESGKIKRTTNGGFLWDSVEVNTLQTFRAVAFSSATNGYAVGDSGVVFSTVDAGASWTKVHGDSAQVLTGVSFNSANTPKIVGNGGILLTGPAFTSVSIATVNLRSIHFALLSSYHTHTDIGFAVGDNGTILKTIDGGISWSADQSNTTKRLRSVFLTTPTWGYAVGDSGAVLRYTNKKWKVVSTFTNRNFYGVDNDNVSVTEVCVGEGGAIMLVCPETIPSGIVNEFTTSGPDCGNWIFDLYIQSLHYDHGDDIINFNALTTNCNHAIVINRTGAQGWATNDNFHARSYDLATLFPSGGGHYQFLHYELLTAPLPGSLVYVTCCLRSEEGDIPYLVGKYVCTVP